MANIRITLAVVTINRVGVRLPHHLERRARNVYFDTLRVRLANAM
jgi:hypothetical protein